MANDAFFQTDDELSEGNLGKALLADNNKDYVDRGGGITGPTNGEITVEAAQAFIEDTASEQLYKVYPSSETLTLPNATGDNYLYITFDPDTQDSATYEITDTQGSGLTNPVSLLRAVIDGSAGTSETRNDAPSGTFESVSTGQVATTDVRWTEVSPSRSFDTWYQAPSDRDIEFTLIVEATSSSTQINVNVSVNDEQSANVMGFPEDVIDSGDNIQTAVLTVPAGHYYRADQFGDAADYEINRWFELR
jgi:hypothetical protein